MNEIFECPFCGRLCKNKRGLKNHINHCKQNPDRTDSANKGRIMPEETKRKISNTLSGVKHTEERKHHISEATKRAMEDPEIRQHISEATTKRFEDPEERIKVSEGLKNYYNNETTEQKQQRIESHTIAANNYYNNETTEQKQQRIENCITAQNRPEAFQRKCVAMKIVANKPEVRQKEYETKKKNNSFHTSKIETELKNYFDSNNIEYISQYKNNLYPFCCDFYFPKYDLYVEIQGSWTHGGKPYIETDPECIKQLENWKSKNTDYYNNAINVWTIRDVKKRETAKTNNLNWIEIFSIDLEECINIIQKHI